MQFKNIQRVGDIVCKPGNLASFRRKVEIRGQIDHLPITIEQALLRVLESRKEHIHMTFDEKCKSITKTIIRVREYTPFSTF